MSLAKCRDCGQEVSTEAPSCPRCGRPLKKKPSLLSIGCFGFLALILFSVIVSEISKNSGNAVAPTTSTRPALGDGWGVENAEAFLRCASYKTRWSSQDLRDTYAILEPSLRTTNLTPHEAQAFVVSLALTATMRDLSIQQARQGMRGILEQNRGKLSPMTKASLDADYQKYCE